MAGAVIRKRSRTIQPPLLRTTLAVPMRLATKVVGGLNAGLTSSKSAVTVVAPAARVRTHVVEFPKELQEPPQPWKRAPARLEAVSVTVWPAVKLAEQVAPHAIPAGLLVTVPSAADAPVLETVSVALEVVVVVVVVVVVQVAELLELDEELAAEPVPALADALAVAQPPPELELALELALLELDPLVEVVDVEVEVVAATRPEVAGTSEASTATPPTASARNAPIEASQASLPLIAGETISQTRLIRETPPPAPWR